ncbi:MAG: hypothetical protein ACFB0B_17570 [Thermonemataceae bacterium]
MKKFFLIALLAIVFQPVVKAQYGTYKEYSTLKLQAPIAAANNYCRAIFSNHLLWNFNINRWEFKTGTSGITDGAAMLMGNNGSIYFLAYNSVGGASRTMTDTQLKDGTRLYIRGDGKVGIGTHNPSPDHLLSVSGKIISEGVRVNAVANWPDYVFLPTYKLRPLSEVELYIKQHNHLPEVPAASAVEKEGINLAEMNATLLKKVEELTLYLIEQDKEINQLKKEVKELKRSKS